MESLPFFGVSVEYFGVLKWLLVKSCSFHFGVLSGRENDSVHIVEDVGFSAFFLHL
jgi:hypothetical protein